MKAIAKWGLWSFARSDWMPDPMYDGDPNVIGPPALYESFMDAARAATNWAAAFRLFPGEWPNPPKLED